MAEQSKQFIQIDDEVREMSAQELKDLSDVQTVILAEEESRKEAKISALAKLAALGLTEEEIAAL